MIPDHPVIRYMERDGYLPRWMRGPAEDQPADYHEEENEEGGLYDL